MTDYELQLAAARQRRNETIAVTSSIGFWVGGIAGYFIGRRVKHPGWGAVIGCLSGSAISGGGAALATRVELPSPSSESSSEPLVL